jgi:hypothetical protein
MIPNYRKFIPKIFAIVAIFLIPITLFLSSGNTLSNSNGFSKSTSLKINTIPAFSNIKIGNNNIGNFNSDIKILEGVNTEISITKNGYKTEFWNLSTPVNQNSFLSFDPLFLMPEKGIEFKSEYNIINIIDKNLAIGMKNDKYYVVSFDFSGISNHYLIEGNLDFTETPIKLDDKSYFFPKSRIIISNENDKYKVTNLSKLFIADNKVLKTSDDSLIILTKDNKLFNYNLKTDVLKYLREGCYDISNFKNNNVAYIMCDNGIFKIDRGSVVSQDLFIDNKIFYYSPIKTAINSNIVNNKFEILNTQSGVAMLYNGTLFINQEGVREWKAISSNIKQSVVIDNKILFLDEDFNLKMVDIYEQYIYYITTFVNNKEEGNKLYYSNDWSRAILYSNSSVQSIFLNKNFIPNLPTTPIIYSKPIEWINQQRCYPEVVEKTQFCLSNNLIIQYRNINFVPTL